MQEVVPTYLSCFVSMALPTYVLIRKSRQGCPVVDQVQLYIHH